MFEKAHCFFSVYLPGHRPKRSSGRILSKKVRKDDYPENGYLVVYHPYTRYFYPSEEEDNEMYYPRRSYKHMSKHNRRENSVYDSNEIISSEEVKHKHHKKGHYYNDHRYKRSHSVPPSLKYCCDHPYEINCRVHLCFG